jgi:hypothetical protein
MLTTNQKGAGRRDRDRSRVREARHRRRATLGRRALRSHPGSRAKAPPRPVQMGGTPRRSRRDPDRPLPARPRGEHPPVIPTGRDRCDRGLLSGYRPLLPSAARALRQPIAGPAAPRTCQEQPDRGHLLGAQSRSRSYTERAPGAVAQLGERLAGSQKVRGSSPLGSTSKAPRTGAFPLSQARRLFVSVRDRCQPSRSAHEPQPLGR